MSQFRRFMTARGLRSALVFLLCGLGIGHAPTAQAGVSAGAAVFPIPSATLLHPGDMVDITIRLLNTSSATPPDPIQFLPATLTAGTVLFFEACLDSACTSPLSNILVFVPVGGTGCVVNAANVTSCAPDNVIPGAQSQVLITVGGAGIPLPALTDSPNFIDVATVRLMANTPVGTPGGAFFIRVQIGSNQVSVTFNSTTATGGAGGTSGLNFPPPPPTNTPTVTPTVTPTATPTSACGDGVVGPGETCDDGNHIDTDDCHNDCTVRLQYDPARIWFHSPSTLNDLLYVHGRWPTHYSVDPTNQVVGVRLSNANSVVYSAELPAGAVQRARGQWVRFRDVTAKYDPNGGIALFEVRQVPNWYRVTVKAYGDISAATSPEMTIEVSFGPGQFTNSGTWKRTRKGWAIQTQ
jgi:cysteine-rich repeat protein